MWQFFIMTALSSLLMGALTAGFKQLRSKRSQAKYVQQLSPSHLKSSQPASSQLNKQIQSTLSRTPLHSILKFFSQRYDIPKDLNLVQLIFIQAGLIFICWNLTSLLKISLIPLLLLAGFIEVISVFLLLSRRRLLDQLDKAFPELLESLASMYHIHPDLKHSFSSSKELVTTPVSQRFLTELTQLTRVGLPTLPSLQIMANRWQYPPLSFLISSIKVHQTTGGNLAQLFRQTATSLRRHQQNTKAMQAVMFQNKVSGFIVCALVPVVLLLSISLSKNYRAVIFGEPLARSLVIAALVWWSIGVVVMWKALRVRV